MWRNVTKCDEMFRNIPNEVQELPRITTNTAMRRVRYSENRTVNTHTHTQTHTRELVSTQCGGCWRRRWPDPLPHSKPRHILRERISFASTLDVFGTLLVLLTLLMMMMMMIIMTMMLLMLLMLLMTKGKTKATITDKLYAIFCHII